VIKPVSKLFAQISDECYRERFDKEITTPASLLVDEIEHECAYVHRNLTTLNINDTIALLEDMYENLQPFIKENLWIALVHDIDMMEHMFQLLADVNGLLEKHKKRYQFSPESLQFPGRHALYTKIQWTFDQLDKYLYVECPEKYNVLQLKQFARFKKINGFFIMKRRDLINMLSRPCDMLYYLEE
jgi:hypothetical protein